MQRKMLYPELVFIDVTPHCNLKCKHCYSKDIVAPKEMSLLEIKHLIKEISEQVINFDIVGREPFMHKNIIDIISCAKKHRLVVNIATNATLINEKIAKKLKQLKVNQIQVSIDHSNRNIHNDFRRSDCFDKIVRGIEYLVKQNIEVVVCTTLTNFNCDDIENIINFIYPLGVKHYRIKTLICDENSKQYQVNKNQYKSVVKKMWDLRNKYPGLYIHQMHHSFLFSKDKKYLPNKDINIPCGACINRISITADKKMTPCIAISHLYNTDFISFNDTWQNSLMIKNWTRVFKSIKGKCSYCGYRYFCGGGCRAAVYGITGDITASDPFCWYNPKGVKYEIK